MSAWKVERKCVSACVCVRTQTRTLTHICRCFYLPVQYTGPKAFLNFLNPEVCTKTMSSSLIWPEAWFLGNMAVCQYYFLHWIPFICQVSVPAYRNVEGFPSSLQIPPCAVYARGRAGKVRCVGAVLHVLVPSLEPASGTLTRKPSLPPWPSIAGTNPEPTL